MSYLSGDTGGYMSMAEAAGEVEPQGLAWTADEMDGWDEDDFEAAGAAMDRDMASRCRRLEEENQSLYEENLELRKD